MTSPLIQWHSLKTRATMFTVAIFVLGIWSLSFYVSRSLQADMERLLGEQQFAAVSFIADGINDELSDRLAVLEQIVRQIDAPLMSHRSALQAKLEQHPILQILFNGGVFVTGPDGTAIADVPLSAGRVGTNYIDRDSVAIPLKEGKTVIGKPAMGKKLGAPIFSMVAPIRAADGKVIGALVATVNLGKPNFLDKVTQRSFGKSGSYILNAPQYRLIVTSSDKTRIMQPLPDTGINAMLDRYVAGYEGYGVSVNSRGIEELSAAKGIPVAGWFMGLVVPTTEAFAPVRDLQQRMLLATLLLTVLTGALTWWGLKRQLSPLVATADAMTALANSAQTPQALPETQQGEIGQLVASFNRILQTWIQREAALKDSQAMLVRTEGIAHVGSWEWDVASDTTQWSDELFRIFQRDPAEGAPSFAEHPELFLPEDMQRLKDAVSAALNQGTPYDLELHALRRDGATRVCLARGHVKKDAASKHVIRLFGSLQDITERKQAEKALRESEELFREMFEQAPLPYQSLDIEGNILGVNKEWLSQLGYERPEVLGRFIGDFITAESIPILSCEFPKFKETGSVDGPVFEFKCRDGTLKYMEVNGRIGRDNASNFLRTHCILTDVTLRKQMEDATRQQREHLETLVTKRTRELAIAKEAAEAANIAKSAFLANMSHEIRTPMNGIIGMTHILRREGVTPKQAKRLATIDTSAEHLLSVINDILDLSKIEAGKFSLEEAPVVVTSLLANVSSILAERVKAKGLHLRIETGNLPPNLVGDPARLQQALLNYATNAVKFTETGSVILRARMQEETAESVLLRFEVQDTGLGISPEAMSRLFSAFEQADNSMTRKYGGTGLGLAITRRLAELMGGKVGADSTAGVGSTFWFSVKLKKGGAGAPAPVAADVDAEAELRQRYAGQRILVVDDERINREIARMELEDIDLATDMAEDGEEAVAMARKTRYAAIFMDMQMPKLNGLDATQQIRQLPGYQDTPIIAMTANAFAEDKAQCMAAGMNDFLIKPFIPEALFAILLRALSRRAG